MTPQENELIAAKEMAEWRIRKVLRKDGMLLDSQLFCQCARGLRKSDWRELINHLLVKGVLIAGTSERDTLTLSIASNAPEQTHV